MAAAVASEGWGVSRVDCCGCESQCLISRPDDQHITSIDYVKLHKAARHHAQSIVTPLGGLQQHHIFSIPSLCLFCWRDVKFRRVSTPSSTENIYVLVELKSAIHETLQFLSASEQIRWSFRQLPALLCETFSSKIFTFIFQVVSGERAKMCVVVD